VVRERVPETAQQWLEALDLETASVPKSRGSTTLVGTSPASPPLAHGIASFALAASTNGVVSYLWSLNSAQ